LTNGLGYARLPSPQEVTVPKPPSPPLPQPRLLRIAAVVERTGLARASVWKQVKLGDFPAPIRITGRAVAWLDTDIDAWIAGRVRERDAPA
jgi:prophage regulatory protein